jgi:type II secretory pathway component PulJ
MTHRRGFTLLEMVLAISLTLGLMGVLMWFGRYTADVRHTAVTRIEQTANRRAVLSAMARHLQAALSDPATGLTLIGESRRVSFAVTALPPASIWTVAKATDEAPPAASDVQVVSYGVDMIETDGAIEPAGLRVAVQMLPSARTQETGVTSWSQLVCPEIRFLFLRYFDGQGWHESWQEDRLPVAVEIVTSDAPLPDGVAAADHPGPLKRRVVRLAAGQRSGPRALLPTGGGRGAP